MAGILDLLLKLLGGGKPPDTMGRGMVITQDTKLSPGVYYLPDGITIAASGITLDGNGAIIIGHDRQGRGVKIENQNNVTIKNLKVREYYHGIYAHRCKNLTVTGCQIAATAEVTPNTVFLDIWLAPEAAYGGGIFLWQVEDSGITANDLQHQMNGLLSYDCRKLTVKDNVANYCSGFGIHLFGTRDSVFEENFADYCSRWQPRGGRTGHMGADATGFLILSDSSRNIFRRNYARLGGDGFFIAGLNPHFEFKPCNNNLFEENDASYSPNIGFEATFCQDNTFKNNTANYCNYGFWLGFSGTNTLEGNTMNYCHQAGIAVENGYGFKVIDNRFHGNTHGVMLWSKHLPDLIKAVPKNDTSYDWVIERNTFTRNDKAIRIAADQDHGVRPFAPAGLRPHHHTLRTNTIRDNRIGIELKNTDDTTLTDNTLDGNVERDLDQ